MMTKMTMLVCVAHMMPSLSLTMYDCCCCAIAVNQTKQGRTIARKAAAEAKAAEEAAEADAAAEEEQAAVSPWIAQGWVNESWQQRDRLEQAS